MAKRKITSNRYAIYLRCSTDDQAEGDFTTIDTQREITLKHLRQKGGVLIKEYSDPGRTGTNLNRPGWKALLKDAEAGLFDVVCVSYLSRLGRGDAGTAAEFLLKDHHVSVEFANEDFGSGKDAFVRKSVARLVDGMYVENVREWTNAKMEQMVAKGYVCGNNKSLGYCKETVAGEDTLVSSDRKPPQRLVPDPSTAPLIRRAFDLFVETRSYADVQAYLRSVLPGKWSFDTTTRLIRNEVYRGVLRFGEWVNYTSHEAIISEAVWDAAQEADRNRTRRPKQQPVDDFPYYLRGLVWCQHCGCRMTPAWHNGRASIVRYYECTNATKNKAVCPIRRVNAATLHDSILSEIIRAAEHPTRMNSLIREAVKQLPEEPDLAADLAAVSRRLREIEQRMARVQEAIEQADGALRPLLQRLEVLESERAPIEASYRELQEMAQAQKKTRPQAAEVCAYWNRLMGLWNETTDEGRGELMEAFVARVEMREKGKGACQVAVLPQTPDSWLELSSGMGAASGTGSIHPRKVRATFHAFHGGKNRKKQPRPWQKVTR